MFALADGSTTASGANRFAPAKLAATLGLKLRAGLKPRGVSVLRLADRQLTATSRCDSAQRTWRSL